MSAQVEVAQQGAVQTVRLNRAEKKNALTGAMYQALADALSAACVSESIAVTVILGQPGIFSAGNDVADFLAAGQAGAPLSGFEAGGPNRIVPPEALEEAAMKAAEALANKRVRGPLV